MSALNFAAALREARTAAKTESAAITAENKFLVKMLPQPLLGPSTIRYVSDYVTLDHANTLTEQLRALKGWHTLPQRRLLSLGGTPYPSGAWVLPLPPFLDSLAKTMAPLFGSHPPDQLLINEYDAGQGIDGHKDGPLYEPTACILSLDSAVLLEFTEDSTRSTTCSVLLEPQSLVMFSDDAYLNLSHQIQNRLSDTIDDTCCNAHDHRGESFDRDRRISITFRRIKGVARRFDSADVAMLSDYDRAELQRREVWFANSISEKKNPHESKSSHPFL